MPAVSVYLKEETLAILDGIVARQAASDRSAGLTGRKVASRSSVLEDLILRIAESSCVSVEDVAYAIVETAEAYGAAKVSLFGSFARGEATDVSDVDILLEKGEIKGMRVLDFQNELSSKLGRKVDVVTTAGVSDRFLKRILPDCIEVYPAGGFKRA